MLLRSDSVEAGDLRHGRPCARRQRDGIMRAARDAIAWAG
ncbi:hypothetical protein EEDFHM_01366 [Methylorubrum populi]